MSVELQYLRIMKHRRRYKSIRGLVEDSDLQPTTVRLLDAFGRYFDKMPEAEIVQADTFLPMFFSWYPKLPIEKKRAYATLLSKISEDLDSSAEEGIVEGLLEQGFAADLANMLTQYEEGDLADFVRKLELRFHDFRRNTKITTTGYVSDPIADLLLEDDNDDGLKWRLSCLNRAMRPLRNGDFGIVAGRPDKGKTTFLASEVSFMAPQIQHKPVLWLNNEGPGRKIKKRLYQAALGLRTSEMIDLSHKGVLEKKYVEATGGVDKIQVYDIHGRDTFAVDRIIESLEPGLVVYDMIDNIRGFGDSARTDLMLERMYQWARELCVKHECVGIATSQISNEGDGLAFPSLPMLKDSKTGKQGASDFQLMIGASNDTNLQGVRYIGLPKNKLRREGYPGDPRAEVDYRPEIARYVDFQGGLGLPEEAEELDDE